MSRRSSIFASSFRQRHSWSHLFADALLALISTMVVTLAIYGLQLYPRIPNISLLYLIVVLSLASTRGHFPAIVASIVAFLSFDYLLVEPLYQFTIARPEEWLALVIFLCTAIITGQLASALRRRAQQAHTREQEVRILYKLVRDINHEEDFPQQLNLVARNLVEVFAGLGVRDCAILLPDEQGKLTVQASACQPVERLYLHPDEVTSAAWVLREGQAVDLYDLARLSRKTTRQASRVVIRSTRMPQSTRSYLSLFPLTTNQRTVGVLRLLIEENPRHFPRNASLSDDRSRADPRSTFFWTFLDQIAALIEHARLQRESVQVEVLRRTDALRAALISSISHDLRTPLASIKAAASSLLQNDVQWDEEARGSFAQAIEREADRLNRLVENLLDMSRIEGGALRPEKEWYPLDELLHDVVDRLRKPLEGRRVTLDIPGGLPPVKLDYLMIDQVLTNLLENALRYTPAGTPITITVQAKATEVTTSVADRGPGIPPGDLERIFDKFYRVSGRARDAGGSGLGLSVSRGLVEAHGGHIWVENRPQGGALFRFTLPRHPSEGFPRETQEHIA